MGLAGLDLSGFVAYRDESTDNSKYFPCSFLQAKAGAEKGRNKVKTMTAVRFIINFNAELTSAAFWRLV